MRTGRLHIRIEADLLKELKRYARQQHKTLTDLVEDHFRFLLAAEHAGKIVADETKVD